MRGSPILMLVLALVFGGGAVYGTKAILKTQHIIEPAEASVPKTTTILVAAVPLRFGDKLTKDNLREINWPNGSLPAGAFSTPQAILKGGDRYVMTAMEANEPVLKWKVTGPGQRATLSAVLDPGKKAVTIRVNDILGVAGFIMPGDRVDVMLTRTLRAAGSNAMKSYVDVLIQGVKVLAVDQVADDRTDKAHVAKAVTVEVDTEQAQKLTLAANVGQLSLALRNSASAAAEATRRVTVGDLGTDPESNLPAPVVVPAAAKVVAPKRPAFTTIGVVRGVERAEYQVPIR